MRRRYLVLAGVIIAIIVVLYYALFICDSSLNIYKKYMIKDYAKTYVEDTYPDTKIDDIDVSYDKVSSCYLVECVCRDKTITLNYNGSFDLEYDKYYDEKYSVKAIEYQNSLKERITKALNSASIPFDSVTVLAELDSSDKRNIVLKDAEITDGKIECTLTRVRKKDEADMDKYELAEYVKTVADCIYTEVGDFASITALNIKYDYDTKGLATITWNRRMENMSLYDIASEIKY